jgi:hypothetical protein
LAVPALRYSYGIVNWHQEELQKLEKKMRKLLTIHAQHHPKADVDPLYVPRKEGRRSLMQLEHYTVEIIELVEYTDSKDDPLVQTLRMHQHIINSAELQAVTRLKTAERRGTRQIKDSIEEKTKEI